MWVKPARHTSRNCPVPARRGNFEDTTRLWEDSFTFSWSTRSWWYGGMSLKVERPCSGHGVHLCRKAVSPRWCNHDCKWVVGNSDGRRGGRIGNEFIPSRCRQCHGTRLHGRNIDPARVGPGRAGNTGSDEEHSRNTDRRSVPGLGNEGGESSRGIPVSADKRKGGQTGIKTNSREFCGRNMEIPGKNPRRNTGISSAADMDSGWGWERWTGWAACPLHGRIVVAGVFTPF